jgi:hypothetical protein
MTRLTQVQILKENLYLTYWNTILKKKVRSNALNDRLFRELCDENDEDFNRLLLHTEVRWLSKGTCLKRFYDLFDSVIKFSENKDDSLRENLLKFKNDKSY